MVYGVGIILFVIRSFAPIEFGVYTLLQTILLLIMAMGQSFALQPLVKFGAETDELSAPVTAAALLYLLFVIPVSLALFTLGGPIGFFFNSETAGGLMHLVGVMLLVSVPRNVASYILQSKLELKKLFFLDALYSIGSLLAIAFLVPTGRVTTAAGVVLINLAALIGSSLYGLLIVFGTYSIRPGLTGETFRKVWVYGKYSLGASVSYTLYAQSDNLIISAVMGPVSLAVYNAAKVFTRIYDLILQLINTLLVPVVSKAHARNAVAELKTLAEKSLFFFTLFTSGIALVSLLFGPWLMRLIYADKYLDGIPVLYILCCTGIFIPGIAVGAAFCHGMANVKPVFQLNLLTAVVGITLIGILTNLAGLNGAAIGMLATFALVFPVWIFTLVRRLGVPITPAGVFGRHADVTSFMIRRFRDV